LTSVRPPPQNLLWLARREPGFRPVDDSIKPLSDVWSFFASSLTCGLGAKAREGFKSAPAARQRVSGAGRMARGFLHQEWFHMDDGDNGASKIMHVQAEPGYVEVMFASSRNEASACCEFLRGIEIPARLEDTREFDAGLGIAVLVPASRFVEASEQLACRVRHAVNEEEDVDDDHVDEDLDDEDDEFDDDEDDDLDDDEDDYGLDDDDEEEFEEEEF